MVDSLLDNDLSHRTFREGTGRRSGDVSGGPVVLIADDDPVIREVLARYLSVMGFQVLTAADGTQAVELYRLHRDRIDLVLLDVCMPKRTGPEAFAELRRIDPAVRCCFMTGDPGEHDISDLFSAGALDLFPKPFRFDALVQRLGQLAGHPTQADRTDPTA